MEEFEVWKDITGYEGMYQVSNFGRVKSLGWNKIRSQNKKSIRADRILKTQTTHRGYLRLELNKNGVGIKFVVHRLVALTFLSNEDDKPEINHINGIKSDNRLANLEWCTSKQNKIHAFNNNLSNHARGENHVCSKLKLEQVRDIRSKFKSGEFKNQTKVAKLFNVTRSSIWCIVNNINWKE